MVTPVLRPHAEEAMDVLLARLHVLPASSPIAQFLDDLLNDASASVDEVARIVALDPTIAMRLLRAVNSAYFGVHEPVSDVTRAIQLMGFDMVREIVNNASILRIFAMRLADQPAINARLEGLWRHSVATGVAARILARRQGIADETPYFAAGLLHDIGKVIQLLLNGAEYERVLRMATTERLPLITAERRLLEFDHAQLGRQVCEAWGQPEEISFAVWRHHSVRSGGLLEACSNLASAVHVGDILARALAAGWWGDHVMPRLEPSARAELELQPLDARELLDTLEEEYPRVATYLASIFPARVIPIGYTA